MDEHLTLEDEQASQVQQPSEAPQSSEVQQSLEAQHSSPVGQFQSPAEVQKSSQIQQPSQVQLSSPVQVSSQVQQDPQVQQPSYSIHVVTQKNSSHLPSGLDSFSIVPSLPVLGALGAAVFLLFVLVIIRRKKHSNQGSSIILVGPSDAGKTAIHSALVFRQVLPSHTTLQANISLISVPSPEKRKPQTLRLIDVPGHPRVRDQVKEYIPDAMAVIFVVDASTVARNGPVVAEHLHHILHALTSLPPSHIPPPLLILAHKFDILSTSSTVSNATLAVSRVRTVLERELERRKTSQAGGVGVAQLGEEEDVDGLGGLECSGTSGFRFKDWEGGEIDIFGSSVISMRSTAESEKVSDTDDSLDGLEGFRQWIQSLL